MKDKVVVITGSSHGLGKALAAACATKGAKVVISAPDTADNNQELQAIDKGIGAVVVTADVTVEGDLQVLAASAVKHFGHIDIWINNAGIWLPKAPIEDVEMKRAHDLFEVNVFGTIYGSRAALAVMKKQGHGAIVNIVSTAALTGRPFFSIYSASKHAGKGFTDSLRDELKEQKSQIKIIGIYPSGIKTHLFDEKKPEDFETYMDVEDVAEKIVTNLVAEIPGEELVIKRPGQELKQAQK